MYGKNVLLPIEFEIKTFLAALELGLDLSSAQKEQVHQLNALDEIRQYALFLTEVVQCQKIRWYDRFIKAKQFQMGDQALLYDSRLKDFK